MIASTPFPTAVQMVVVARRMSTSTTMKSPVVRTSWNSPGEKQTSTDLVSCNTPIPFMPTRHSYTPQLDPMGPYSIGGATEEGKGQRTCKGISR